MTIDEIVADQQRFVRELLYDPAALAPPTTVPDPRLTHGFGPIWEPGFVGKLRSSIAVPVLAIETPASPTPTAERGARLKDYAGSAAVVEAETADAGAVTAALRDAGWL
jgi:hypothetical protein